MAFTHETNPKIKNKVPIINIEMKVSLLFNEPASTTAVIVFDMDVDYCLVVLLRGVRWVAEDLSIYKVQFGCNCRMLAG